MHRRSLLFSSWLASFCVGLSTSPVLGFTNATDGMLALPVQVRFVSACHALYLRCASPRLREVECVPMTQYWHPYFFRLRVGCFPSRWRRSNSSRDVRVRVRPGVVRVRVSEPAIRTVVRVTAAKPQLSFPFAYLPGREEFRCPFYAFLPFGRGYPTGLLQCVLIIFVC